MDRYVLIASRDRFTARDIDGFCELAAGLAIRGHQVTLFLVQNGVLGARRGPGTDPLARLTRAGVTILADDFSLRERGIEPTELREGVQPASIDALVDLIVRPDTKTLWH